MDDMQLIQRYAQSGCQESFETLVTRHLDWVYSVCLRGVKDRHLAEDVAQAVFTILAREGIAVPLALLLLLLTTRASQAAPLGLGLSISSAATGSSVAGGMATAIAKGVSRQMLRATGRLLAALAASALLLIIA